MLERTHHCAKLTKEDVGKTVVLNGWVQRRRDLGGVLFIDLRDRSGIVQIVFNPEWNKEAHAIADRVRNEYVVGVMGTVVERDPETVNPNLETGEIEVRVERIEILNPAKTPPFFIEDGVEIDETLRLKYRYLDLRRPEMLKTLMLRSKAAKVFRDFLDEHGFIEIETPILTKSTPEGARDYLVPSRVHPGEFFALPQSPQIFKQLLMVGGIERYYQIARCFRDEDLRADRQPEFTQVDIETSFMSRDQLLDMMEELIVRVFRETIGVEIPRPFQRITYADAIGKYGSDKPDLRFGLELVDISDIAAASGVQRLSRQIGRKLAVEMMLTGRHVSAEEGHRLGFVNQVVPKAQLMEAAMNKAREICAVSPSSVKATKRVLNHMDELEQLKASLLYSRLVMAELRETEDFKEGVNAFVEKRAPQWKNR